jgi:hypothetical protein
MLRVYVRCLACLIRQILTYCSILPPEGNSDTFAEGLRRTIFRDGTNLLCVFPTGGTKYYGLPGVGHFTDTVLGFIKVTGCLSLKYSQQDATFSRSIYCYKLLYMFQAVPPPETCRAIYRNK